MNRHAILSKSILKKYYETKKDMEKSLPSPIDLKDSQFIEILINFYLENKEKKWNHYLELS